MSAKPIANRRVPRKPRRPGISGLFQFHLSTALVLMVVAGALIGANVPHDAIGRKSGLIYVRQGWPYCFYADWHREDPDHQLAVIDAWFQQHPNEPAATLINDIAGELVEHGLRLDIMIGAFILIVTVVVTEILNRTFVKRRTRPKPSDVE
jgi:hypothetical protein